MKKFVTGLFLGIGISSCTAVFASQSIQAYLFPSKITFHVNGEPHVLDVSGENQVINYNNKTYIPLRLFAESLGAKVDYQAPSSATNGDNQIDIQFIGILDGKKSENAWTLTQTNGFKDGILAEDAGVSFGKADIDYNAKSIKPLIQFKNSMKKAIHIQPLQIEYEVVKVDAGGDTVLFDYKVPPLQGKVPASSWFTANVPSWDFKDNQGNIVEPGKYALLIKVPASLDYAIEGAGETKTISYLSKFSRWEYDITQEVLDQLNKN